MLFLKGQSFKCGLFSSFLIDFFFFVNIEMNVIDAIRGYMERLLEPGVMKALVVDNETVRNLPMSSVLGLFYYLVYYF
jgi:hypothetical protein